MAFVGVVINKIDDANRRGLSSFKNYPELVGDNSNKGTEMIPIEEAYRHSKTGAFVGVVTNEP